MGKSGRFSGLAPRLPRGLIGAVAFYCLLALAPSAQGQGCSMCRETASYQKERAVNALKNGIVLLAIPPLAIIGGIGWVTYRRWNESGGSA